MYTIKHDVIDLRESGTVILNRSEPEIRTHEKPKIIMNVAIIVHIAIIVLIFISIHH